MLLSEMISLNSWIADKESLFQPIAKLAKLQQILNSNIQARAPNNRQSQAIQSFTEEKNEAIAAIRRLKLTELSKDQITCLSVHGADEYMGDLAAQRLKNAFRDEVHDHAYLAKKVAEAHSSLSQARAKIAEVSKFLMPYTNEIQEANYLEDKARFSIIFKDGVKIDSLKDLELRSKEWSVIMHGIGVALDVPPNEFKVLGARNGSLVIDLFMCAAAIVPIGFILNRSLAILERFALSMKRLDAIYELDIEDPAFKEIEDEIKATNEKYFNLKKLVSAKSIAKEILDERECPEDKRPEAESHLESSVRKILNHLRKGGDLDAFVPHAKTDDESTEEENSAEEANSLISEFRHKKLELNKEELVRLLEHFDFDDEE
ncbi:hypothetical protein [Shewanella algae]|uniref:hypothetical protein n=1 Tax=Shewanella algae TaxID=38313 RepID=UPI001AB00AE3|nr:hypothetical protein [Shewanella algae]MBO2663279.1 hypothetical protein [Shewanella algae]MCL1053445.1 hypothetical protein [Shewanella algae]